MLIADKFKIRLLLVKVRVLLISALNALVKDLKVKIIGKFYEKNLLFQVSKC